MNSRKKTDTLKAKKYDIDIPIIAVLGQGRNCCKFETQLLIREVLCDAGYQVSCITSNSLGALLGCYTMPSFIYNNAYSFEEKVIKLNNYVYLLSKAENPDVILIGLPEGISPFNEGEYNHFAEYPLIIANALPIDIGVLCIYYMNQISMDGIRKLNDFCINKYKIPIGAISISNVLFSYDDARRRLDYFFFNKEYMDKHSPETENVPFPIINVNIKKKSKVKAQQLINFLESNVDII